MGEMTFVFPYAGLLLLRGRESDPKEATIHLVTPDDSISYHVPIIKIIDFSLEEIFEKRLYFLIPFYIFNYEKRFPELENDEKGRRDLVAVYEMIFQNLEEEAKCGELSELSMHVIINMTRRIVYNLAKKHPKVQEEVGDFMGGEPYDLEIVRMYREAEAKGMAKGQAEGESRLASAIQDLRTGMTREQLLEKYDESTVDLAFVVK